MGARAWVLAALVAGCTPFEGRRPDAGVAPPTDTSDDRPFDAVGEGPTDAGTDRPFDASGDRPTDEARPDVANPDVSAPEGDASTCGQPTGPCNLLNDTGCAAGTTCRLASAIPLRAACGVAGTVARASRCGAEGDCVAGDHCVRHYCVPLCCNDGGGDAACAAMLGPLSHCALATGSFAVYACTLPGACDYTDRSAAHGGCEGPLRCYPSFAGVGLGECRMPGDLGVGRECTLTDECVGGATCVGGVPSACRPICNPRNRVSECAGSTCQTFTDRPLDFGVCI